MNSDKLEERLLSVMSDYWQKVSKNEDYEKYHNKVIETGEVMRFYSRKNGKLLDPADEEFNERCIQTLVTWGWIDPLGYLEMLDEKTMTDVLKLRMTPFDYDSLEIKRHGSLSKTKYNFVVPVKESSGGEKANIRLYQAKTLITYLHRYLFNKSDWSVTFVVQETDDTITKELIEFSEKYDWNNVNVFTIVSDDMFMKKSACYNYVCKNVECEWQINHDVDLLFTKEFITGIEEFCDSGKGNFFQPFYGGLVIPLNERSTKTKIEYAISGNPMDLSRFEVELPDRPIENYAPGGSIVVKQDFMKKVGGYDPQVIEGYGPEDGMFWMKLELASGPISKTDFHTVHYGNGHYSKNPKTLAFHMAHAPGVIDGDKSLIPLVYYLFLTVCPYEVRIKFLKRLDGAL